jgi:hypothetical protein
MKFSTRLKRLKKELIDDSFIADDKKIHFGKIHVVYIGSVVEKIDELIRKVR